MAELTPEEQVAKARQATINANLLSCERTLEVGARAPVGINRELDALIAAARAAGRAEVEAELETAQSDLELTIDAEEEKGRMTTELCAFVVERAKDGICEMCGEIHERRTTFRPYAVNESVPTHPFLGRPIALCGHGEGEHTEYHLLHVEPEPNEIVWVCTSCRAALPSATADAPITLSKEEGKLFIAARHPYTPVRTCETCRGEGEIMQEDDSYPCPAGCVNGLVLT